MSQRLRAEGTSGHGHLQRNPCRDQDRMQTLVCQCSSSMNTGAKARKSVLLRMTETQFIRALTSIRVHKQARAAISWPGHIDETAKYHLSLHWVICNSRKF